MEYLGDKLIPVVIYVLTARNFHSITMENILENLLIVTKYWHGDSLHKYSLNISFRVISIDYAEHMLYKSL